MNCDFDIVVVGGGIVGSAIAAGLAAKGHSVVLVERGDMAVSSQVEARPIIKCTKRMHMGCFQARNHVLGGNGHYWGGGLIRPPSMGLDECLGISEVASEDLESLAANFRNVEELFGVQWSPSRTPFPLKDSAIGTCHLSEICVLPGKLRNTSRYLLERFRRMPRCETLTCAKVASFTHNQNGSSGRNVSSLIINQGGKLRELAARSFVIAAGTVDSNLIVLAHAQGFGVEIEKLGLGSRLHDHLSVPIARVRLSSNRELKDLLAPRFMNGLVRFRRFELKCGTGWGAEGFVRFLLGSDEISPYQEIKRLMLLRQQGASPTRLIKASLPLLSVTPELFRVAIERVLKRRLYLSDDLVVSATLNFETFPHPANALRLVGDQAELAWTINEQDELSYLELLDKANRLIAELARNYGMAVEPLADFSSPQRAIDYFHTAATDTFHLGGGLAASDDGMGAVDQNLKLVGTGNVYVVSSAVLRRPGVVNPTHTLLALADRFVNRYRMEA